MGTLNEQLVELIKDAFDLEFNSKRFYLFAVEVTNNVAGKKMFQKLADEEDGHMEAFEKIISTITGNDEWKEIATEEARTIPPSAIVESFKATVDKWIGNKQSADDTVALRMAMELERRAIVMFEGMSKRAKNPQVKALAESLADEERYHYDMLQAQHDNILSVGIWMDDAEFQMDGKF
jgi:rubrerythrin